jgi:F0F1-type ATP synthase membrane subunit c/vacuolar-type H+-ATPase subunit K
MESDNALYAFRTMPSGHPNRAEQLLLRVPILLAVALGLVFMVGRFVQVLSEDLKQPPDSWGAVLLFAMMIGTVTLVVLLACAAAGATVGLVLRAVVQSVSKRHRSLTEMHRKRKT